MSTIVWALTLSSLATVPLLGFRWYLDFKKWELSQKAAERDAALAELSPRLKALEAKINDVEWARAGRTR